MNKYQIIIITELSRRAKKKNEKKAHHLWMSGEENMNGSDLPERY